MDASSMTFDEFVSWEKEESLSPLLRIPHLKPRRKGIEFQGKSLYVEFFHADCVDDHFDPLDYWSYEDVYGGGCFDASGSFKGYDLTDEFSNERSKMLSLRKSIRIDQVKAGVAKINPGRSNYGNLVSVIGLNEDVGDDEPQRSTQLSHTGCSCNNDLKDVD
ncbi:hypothetical protein Tco_1183562 [Tanacetum coccineum]